MGNVLRASQLSALPDDILQLFGAAGSAIEDVAQRARLTDPGASPIVWECYAQSFGFSFVSDPASILGYPRERWFEPGFWTDCVVHDDDREDAVTYCGLATQKARDHMFEYRARAADGRMVWLRDYVKVVRADNGSALKLRGVMFDVTSEKLAHPSPAARIPTREQLVA